MQESKKTSEFESLKPGDKIEAKVLRKIQDAGRTFIELTRRKEHLKLDEGLDEDLLRLLSLDTLKEGQSVSGIVTDVAPPAQVTKISCPIQAQISPFVRATLLFSDLFDPKNLLESSVSLGDLINKKYKVGQRIEL